MKTKILILFALAIGLVSCENQDNEFDDFGSTSVYFPFQNPVRTLIQGDYDLGFNENDNNGRFVVGVTMSGVYSNETDRKVHFVVDPAIIDPAELGVTDVNVKVLPEAYYTIEQTSPVTIPSGSTKGRIPVKLSDAFFDDPLAFFTDKDSVNYVLPLKITSIEGLDVSLTGVPAEGITDPKRVVATDWEVAPKDYTLYGIKFKNKYDGIYLRRGADKIVGTSEIVKEYTSGAPTETTTENIDDSTIYSEENVVDDEVTPVLTAGRSEATSSSFIRRAAGLPNGADITLLLTVDANEDIVVSNADQSSPLVITGTGKFVENGDAWGGEARHVMYLEYGYQDQTVEVEEQLFLGSVISTTTTTVNLQHTVNDTLVIRDRDVKFEQFELTLTP